MKMKPRFVLWSALSLLLWTWVAGAEEMKVDDLQSCHWMWQLPETETLPGASYANEEGIYKFMPAPIADSNSYNYAIWVAYSPMRNRYGEVVRGIHLNSCFWGRIDDGIATPRYIFAPVTRVNQDSLYLVVVKYNRDDHTLTMIGGPWFVWRHDVESGVAAVEAKNSTAPTTFALSQNYPNPFNSTTNIKYALAQPSHIRLSVFNTMGQAIAELVNAEQPAGTYRAVWDGKDMPSGIYFCRLEANGLAQTKKITLMK